jgi:hypothetical protein
MSKTSDIVFHGAQSLSPWHDVAIATILMRFEWVELEFAGKHDLPARAEVKNQGTQATVSSTACSTLQL